MKFEIMVEIFSTYDAPKVNTRNHNNAIKLKSLPFGHVNNSSKLLLNDWGS